MTDRRRFERHHIMVPINVSTSARRDRAGMIRDVSLSGVLFQSRSKFEIGERVVMYFELPNKKGSAAGRVVRAETDDSPNNQLRFLTAVRFDAPLLDLPL